MIPNLPDRAMRLGLGALRLGSRREAHLDAGPPFLPKSKCLWVTITLLIGKSPVRMDYRDLRYRVRVRVRVRVEIENVRVGDMMTIPRMEYRDLFLGHSDVEQSRAIRIQKESEHSVGVYRD